jgi:hypothetical protein
MRITSTYSSECLTEDENQRISTFWAFDGTGIAFSLPPAREPASSKTTFDLTHAPPPAQLRSVIEE